MVILYLYAVGILEAYYLLPRFGNGLEGMLGAVTVTAFLAGYWVRTRSIPESTEVSIRNQGCPGDYPQPL
jgi:hypothetical protein